MWNIWQLAFVGLVLSLVGIAYGLWILWLHKNARRNLFLILATSRVIVIAIPVAATTPFIGVENVAIVFAALATTGVFAEALAILASIRDDREPRL